MDQYRTLIIVPALNEAENLSNTIGELLSIARVLVVDDGSFDNTALLAYDNGADVIQHIKNMGYGEALETGFIYAIQRGFQFVVTCDADGQHPPTVVRQVVDLLECGADVVIAERTSMARFGEYCFSVYARLRYGVHDPLSGLKGYLISALRGVDRLDMESSIGTGLLFSMLKRGKKVSTFKFNVLPRTYGSPRFGSGLKANYKLLIAIFRDLSKKYK